MDVSTVLINTTHINIQSLDINIVTHRTSVADNRSSLLLLLLRYIPKTKQLWQFPVVANKGFIMPKTYCQQMSPQQVLHL